MVIGGDTWVLPKGVASEVGIRASVALLMQNFLRFSTCSVAGVEAAKRGLVKLFLKRFMKP
jgi:hypothetical protein